MGDGKKVLVIDDSPFIFKAVKKALEPKGYEMVGHAMNGKEGLDLYDQHKPDAITLDVTMPVMDGLETARHLFEKDASVKIVMLSAMGDEDLLNEARALGVKFFLSKPFKADELAETIGQLLGG